MTKSFPDRLRALRIVATWAVLAMSVAAGCGKRDAPKPAPSADAPPAEMPAVAETIAALPDTASPSPAAVPSREEAPPAARAEVAPKPQNQASQPVSTPVTTPAPEIPPAQNPAPEPVAVPPVEPAPEAAVSSKVVDPGGVVEVTATKAGLARVGAAKCKTCHAVQFASWSASAHAARTPPLDCESCHGAGSAYKTLSVMKDPQQARAAGLVMPDRTFCATCHRNGWSEDMLTRTHAHKTTAGGK